MYTTPNNETYEISNSEWILLTKASWHESTPHKDQTIELWLGSFLTIIKELGLHPEHLGKIGRTLTETVDRARLNFSRARLNIPIDIRLFCQRGNQIGDLHNHASSKLDSEISIGTLQELLEINISLDNLKSYLSGGWGFFIIERGSDLASATRTEPHCIIDLYLYKEGE